MGFNQRLVYRLLGAVIMAAVSLLLSIAFKELLHAPNYGLGIVIGVTISCYFFGLNMAGLALVLSLGIGSTLLHFFEPGGFYGEAEGLRRVVTIVFACLATCSLVFILQHSARKLSRTNELLRDVQDKLSEALDRERRIAGTIQAAFLPRVPERIGDISLAAVYVPGSDEAHIGGDFYDIQVLDDGRISIAIGDVSGKGIDAARQAVTARYGLRSFLLDCKSPADCLNKLNRFICRDGEFAGFVTLFFGILDPETRTLAYCTGGHVLPIVLKQADGQLFELTQNGQLLGAVQDATYSDDSLDLESGDMVLLATDGLTEARNSEGFLGEDGLAKLLCEIGQESELDVRSVLDTILARVREYAHGRLNDDVTAVLVQIGSSERTQAWHGKD